MKIQRPSHIREAIFTAISLGLVLIAQSASAQIYDQCLPGQMCTIIGGPGHYEPERPHWPGDRPQYPAPQPGYERARDIYINAGVQNQSLDLLRLANISLINDRGAQITRVEVQSQNGPRAVLSLTANGRIEAQSYGAIYTSQLIPRNALIIGQNVSQLLLQVQGRALIQTIRVYLRGGGYNPYPPPNPWPQPNPPPYPQPPYPPHPGQNMINLDRFVNVHVSGQSSVELGNLVGLGAYPGYRIQAITIQGRTLNGYSTQAKLLINGLVSNYLSLTANSTAQTIYPSQNVGVNSLVLWVNDTSVVERVQIQLVRY